MDEDKVQLEQELAAVEQELEAKKEELAQVRAELGYTEDGQAPEGMLNDDGTPAEGVDPDLIAKEAQLSEDIQVLQAKLVALRKRLNDVESNEAMANYGEE